MSLPPLPLPVPTNNEEDTKITENESDFILTTSLKAADRNNPTILAYIASFVRCKNNRQASAEAGIDSTEGYKLRMRVDVSDAIRRLIDKSVSKHGFDASEIVERVKEVIDFDPIELQNPDGTFKREMAAIAPEARRALKKLKVKNIWGDHEDLNGIERKIIIGEIIEYEFADKLKSAELLGREKETFKSVTKVEHGVSKDMANLLLESRRRGEQASEKFIIDITPERD